MNPNKDALSAEKLKTFAGCEDYDTNEASEIVKTIRQIALILFQYSSAKNSLSIDNQLNVSLCKGKAKVIPLKSKLNPKSAIELKLN